MTFVLVLEWVLRVAWGMPVAEVVAVLEDLLSIESLTVDRAGAVARALKHYAAGLDFADALHLAHAGVCGSLATFDRRFANKARKQGLSPPVQVP